MPDSADYVALNWEPIDGGDDGDQQTDLPFVHHWASIGPEDADCWSYTILELVGESSNEEVDGGFVATEAEAKAAVEAWRPPQHKDGDEGA